MIFVTRQDIDAPAAQVFDMLTDFDTAEILALRRGIEVERTSGRGIAITGGQTGRATVGVQALPLAATGDPVPGIAWRARFVWRSRQRDMVAHVTVCERPGVLAFAGQTDTLNGTLRFDVVELSQRRTRLAVSLEIKPRTLTARLMLQSARLTKGSLQARFAARVRTLAEAIETRARKSG